MKVSQEQSNSFLKQAGPPGYYRWRIATEFLQMPTHFSGRVLDVGAQNGAFLERLQADFKVGVDLVESPISSLPWSRADASLLPFTSNSFHHVLAFDIIEHVPADDRVLAEIGRILAPGGTLWLSTTQADFYLFPGGALQQRFESAWGHVRRGYSYQELRTKIPASLQGPLLRWREPAFRYSYVFLKLVHARWPRHAQTMMDWMYEWDARHVHGGRGHWFARLQKTDL